VRAAIAGVDASKYRVGEDQYNIRVRLRENQRVSPTDLENLRITFMNRRGQLLSIPLTSVADLKRRTAVADIKRKDQKRVVTVTGDIEGRVQSEVIKEVRARIGSLPLPAGYGIKLTGSQEEQQKASDFISNAFVITLLLVFLIMVAEFNSLKVPFVILTSVILSLIGVMLGLVVTGTPASVVMTGVGVVALAGIVVRNGIVLLDFVKHKHGEEGLPLEEALLEAGRIRLRPVVLTAAATVLGVLPMATGIDFDWREFHFIFGAESAEFWRPLAVTIIFGLTVSTFLTLVIVPTVYSLLEDWTSKISAFFARFRKSDNGVATA
jgi:multidrug efflux pump subunit AcrB